MLSSLLGVKIPTTQKGTAFGGLIQYGNSVKVVGEGEDQDLSAATTGNFLIDALSDENGDIFIDGKAIEINLDTVHQFPYKEGDKQRPASDGMMTTQQAVQISAGADKADLNAFRNNWWFYRSAGTEIVNYQRNGKSSEWYYAGVEWQWGFIPHFVWKKRFIMTDMELENTYYEHEPKSNIYQYITRESAFKHTDALTLKRWAVFVGMCVGYECKFPIETYNNGIAELDYFDTVCARGRAGSARGSDGTSSFCDGDIF